MLAFFYYFRHPNRFTLFVSHSVTLNYFLLLYVCMYATFFYWSFICQMETFRSINKTKLKCVHFDCIVFIIKTHFMSKFIW